jgi:hypothetical protein
MEGTAGCQSIPVEVYLQEMGRGTPLTENESGSVNAVYEKETEKTGSSETTTTTGTVIDDVLHTLHLRRQGTTKIIPLLHLRIRQIRMRPRLSLLLLHLQIQSLGNAQERWRNGISETSNSKPEDNRRHRRMSRIRIGQITCSSSTAEEGIVCLEEEKGRNLILLGESF